MTLEELEEVISNIEEYGKQNKGLFFDRGGQNELQKSLKEEWMKMNINSVETISSVKMECFFSIRKNNILQMLFTEYGKFGYIDKTLLDITPRDRFVVATIIQWLGTNVGSSFLETALNNAGFKITKI